MHKIEILPNEKLKLKTNEGYIEITFEDLYERLIDLIKENKSTCHKMLEFIDRLNEDAQNTLWHTWHGPVSRNGEINFS